MPRGRDNRKAGAGKWESWRERAGGQARANEGEGVCAGGGEGEGAVAAFWLKSAGC